MKDDTKLIGEIAQKFFFTHPELANQTGNAFYGSMVIHARQYSMQAIDFTVKYIQEQLAMEKKPGEEK